MTFPHKTKTDDASSQRKEAFIAAISLAPLTLNNIIRRVIKRLIKDITGNLKQRCALHANRLRMTHCYYIQIIVSLYKLYYDDFSGKTLLST